MGQSLGAGVRSPQNNSEKEDANTRSICQPWQWGTDHVSVSHSAAKLSSRSSFSEGTRMMKPVSEAAKLSDYSSKSATTHCISNLRH